MSESILIKTKEGADEYMPENDLSSFDEWMKRCDKVLMRTRGMSIHDLPDCTYRDWYDERLKPVFAVNRALSEFTGYDIY